MSPMVSLEIVDLAYNSLVGIPGAVTSLKKLKALDISFNKNLMRYPPQIIKLTMLRVLNVKGCMFTSKQLDMLTTLLSDCQIMY